MHTNFFHTKLKALIHKSVLLSYKIVRKFPNEELYGASSQLRRAAISIMLNYTEGFGRFKPKGQIHFLETSYGSLKECKHLVFLAKELQWINSEDYSSIAIIHDEIGKMLWKTIEGMKKTMSSVT